MSRYLLRLDDACEHMHVRNWQRMEDLLVKYSIRPLVGIIPCCDDPDINAFEKDRSYLERLRRWKSFGWFFALHGYDHVYLTNDGGINPVHNRSEFAGVSYDAQKEKLAKGYAKIAAWGITPVAFFAPSHTFDWNTLKALKEVTPIRFVSDTVAFDCYSEAGITFVPQQTGHVKSLPFATVTFCYHPNTMNDRDFDSLENFLNANNSKFSDFPLEPSVRRKGWFDRVLEWMYFTKRRFQ